MKGCLLQKLINVKIDQEERDLYSKICKEEDTTMSQDIRKFIRSRIEKYKKKK
jgi:hypothetical protein